MILLGSAPAIRCGGLGRLRLLECCGDSIPLYAEAWSESVLGNTLPGAGGSSGGAFWGLLGEVVGQGLEGGVGGVEAELGEVVPCEGAVVLIVTDSGVVGVCRPIRSLWRIRPRRSIPLSV